MSKQLYLHGLEHAETNGELNKMIAVHNFHNAIEIALKAILLTYDIRGEKQLNIEFEVMLNQIDNHNDFKAENIKLPYRQELRNLNILRNLVQHHVVEPEASNMDDWKVFTKRFLIKSLKQYFEIDFDTISSADFIIDSKLKQLLKLAEDFLINKDYLKAVFFAKLAFISASDSIIKFLPDKNQKIYHHWAGNEIEEFIGLFYREIDDVHAKIDDVYNHTALLSTGISLADKQKFERLTPEITFGYARISLSQASSNPTAEDARWLVNFVVKAFTNWQLQGMNPVTIRSSYLKEILDDIDNFEKRLQCFGKPFSKMD